MDVVSGFFFLIFTLDYRGFRPKTSLTTPLWKKHQRVKSTIALREEEESERKRLSEEHEQDLTKTKLRKAEEDKWRLRDDQEWKEQREQERRCIEEGLKEEQQ